MMELNIQLFASTNKTANYELPQFVGTDKPTWLGDFNSAMADIDAGMHENASDISSMASDVQTATSTASQASQNVASLTSTVNTLSSTVSSVQTTANNASQTASSALNTANTANGKADTNASDITSLKSRTTVVENDLNEFNIDTFTKITKENTTVNNVNSDYLVSDLVLATNSHNKSIFKLYGTILGKLTNWQQQGYISFNSSLRPETDITINGAGVCGYELNSSVVALGLASITIKTNGEVRIILPVYGQKNSTRIILTANLYFVKDFGDIVPEE